MDKEHNIRNLYAKGFSWYRAGFYQKAEDVFLSLTFADPLQTEFWQALASSLQMQKKWSEAVLAWEQTYVLSLQNPIFLLHQAECLLLAGNQSAALDILQIAKQSADDSLRQKISTLQEGAFHVYDR